MKCMPLLASAVVLAAGLAVPALAQDSVYLGANIDGRQVPSGGEDGATADFNAAMNGGADLVEALAAVGGGFAWVLPPFVGGLVLMGLGRIIMLLTAINRALRRG